MKSKNNNFWVGMSFYDVPAFYIDKNILGQEVKE